jgi:hypothetical protein
MTSEELRALRAELLETKESLWAELNQAIGALALLDHLIEIAEKGQATGPAEETES